MSADPSFQCPVCRALQRRQSTCRRCKADLSLVVRAYDRLDDLLAQREEAIARNDPQRAKRLATELGWLAPGRWQSP